MAVEALNDDIDLSVVVPAYNAAHHLLNLAHKIFGLKSLGIRSQMICIDDGSTDNSADVMHELANLYPDFLFIREEENLGAGISRNSAWPHVKGRYCIFFDADDILHEDVIYNAIQDLDADPLADVAMFAYRYEREEEATYTSMGYKDQKIFEDILQGEASITGQLGGMASLLRFTNYPWNKIIRTSHFSDVGMRFGKTRVNNDILGHWNSLLLARQIIVRGEVICTHIVHPTGNNITNNFGLDRMQMFDALGETYDFIKDRPELRRRFAHHFWALTQDLTSWARPRLDSDFTLLFDQRHTDLVAQIDIGDLARIRSKHAPQLANALVKQLTS